MKYSFNPDRMRWIRYEPKAEMLVLHNVYPNRIDLPDYFFGRNIVHLPTTKCGVYTSMTGSVKDTFGGLLQD